MMDMDKTDRISFLAEWQDSFSSVNWKFNLFFYLADETIEMYDLLKHRLFLKRTKCEGIRMDDLFVGATLRICSRLVVITDFADSYTCSIMEVLCQKSCGFLKPDIGNRKGEILQSFTQNHFKIIDLKMTQLSEMECRKLLHTYEDESILKSVIKYLTSGPILAFQLLGENVVEKCLELVGPEDPAEAKKTNPDCLRARYGTDKVHNAIYVSSSTAAAQKDYATLFDVKTTPVVLSGQNTSCCVIKPHAVKMGLIGSIVSAIEESGYEITAVCKCTLTTKQAEKFYEVYKYVIPEYHDMVLELCSGPCVALEVKSQRQEEETSSELRKLAGPMDSDVARLIRPDSIRARFGKSKVQNSIHVTDLEEDAPREVYNMYSL